METLSAVMHNDPVPPSRLNGNVPRTLDTICMKCLSKEPTRRYPSAEALAEDIGRFLEGGSVQARRPGFWGRLTRWLSVGK
jgi:hypothetical protein